MLHPAFKLSTLALVFACAVASAYEPPQLIPPPLNEPPKKPTTAQLLRQLRELPLATIPETVGIRIEKLPADAATLDAIQKAGFQWASVGLPWADAEKQPGVFDFANYAQLAEALRLRKIKPVFALGLTNPLYEDGQPPRTDAGRAAFAAFAGAAARSIQKAPCYWEIGEEPNAKTAYKSLLSAADYDSILAAASKAIRAESPKASVLSGGLRGADTEYLRAALSGGLVDSASGASIRPFREEAPETWKTDLATIREEIVAFSPHKSLPLAVTAWGYPSKDDAASEEAQARRLVRAALVDFGENLPLTIWGGPASASEEDYGLFNSKDGSPKPALRAAEFMNGHLAGLHLKRVRELPWPLQGLVFSGGRKTVSVLWSAVGERTIQVKIDGDAAVFNLYGEPSSPLQGKAVDLKLTESPIYADGSLEIVSLGK